MNPKNNASSIAICNKSSSSRSRLQSLARIQRGVVAGRPSHRSGRRRFVPAYFLVGDVDSMDDCADVGAWRHCLTDDIYRQVEAGSIRQASNNVVEVFTTYPAGEQASSQSQLALSRELRPILSLESSLKVTPGLSNRLDHRDDRREMRTVRLRGRRAILPVPENRLYRIRTLPMRRPCDFPCHAPASRRLYPKPFRGAPERERCPALMQNMNYGQTIRQYGSRQRVGAIKEHAKARVAPPRAPCVSLYYVPHSEPERAHTQSKAEMSPLAGTTIGEAYGHHASGER